MAVQNCQKNTNAFDTPNTETIRKNDPKEMGQNREGKANTTASSPVEHDMTRTQREQGEKGAKADPTRPGQTGFKRSRKKKTDPGREAHQEGVGLRGTSSKSIR